VDTHPPLKKNKGGEKKRAGKTGRVWQEKRPQISKRAASQVEKRPLLGEKKSRERALRKKITKNELVL